MEYLFLNAEHERIFREAKALLDGEIERQQREAERLATEWAYYPEDERNRNRVWLLHHFHECRRPYAKILTDIVALCPAVTMISVDDAQKLIPLQ